MASILRKSPETNVGETERWVSMIGGTGLVAMGLARRDKSGAVAAIFGGMLLWRGASGHCNMYQAFGVNTTERGHEKGTGSDAGVPYELGIRVDHDIEIDKPVDELYRFWRKLENLPRFMHHLDSVHQLDDKHSRWVALGPAGMKIEWDAEIVNEIENSVIGWRTTPGSQVDIGGSVRFEDAGDGRSRVKVSMQYNPPAGKVGRLVARTMGEDPSQAVRDDLDRFKELMERGAVTTKTGKRSADEKWARPGRAWNRDSVNSSSEESFPASDAPSWTPERV
jgi:uncharacterized membrane protein